MPGEGGSGRERRAGGSTGTTVRRALGDSLHLPVTGAGAPGPSPSDNTTLTLSPGRGATYTAEAANRGEGGNKTRPAQPRGERLPPPPSPPLAPLPLALLSPAAAFPFSFACRRHRCRRRRRRSTNYIRATPRLRPSANLGSFRRAPPLPPSALLPSPRSSGRPPSANLGSLGFSSSSEAWLAAWRALSSFRLPLLFLTLTSGHCYSSLRRVLPGDPLEAGSGGPGVRGEGAVFGRRTVGRERSHLGLSTGGWATARAPRRGRRRGEGALGERSGRRLPPLRAGRAGPGGRQALSGRRADCDPGASSASRDRSCPRGGGQRATAPLGPVPGTGPGHPPQTGCFARRRPATGRGRLELGAAG